MDQTGFLMLILDNIYCTMCQLLPRYQTIGICYELEIKIVTGHAKKKTKNMNKRRPTDNGGKMELQIKMETMIKLQRNDVWKALTLSPVFKWESNGLILEFLVRFGLEVLMLVAIDSYDLHICSLMYLTASRPDIMFAVCACARDSPFDLEAFSDNDYAGASLDRKSTTGGAMDSKPDA
ncbi:hypothetical protein Tco_0676143 [Tanacetum coccineum]